MPRLVIILLQEGHIEIHNIHHVILCDQNILRFDVAMCDVLAVQVCDAFHYLFENYFGHLLCVVALRLLGDLI